MKRKIYYEWHSGKYNRSRSLKSTSSAAPILSNEQRELYYWRRDWRMQNNCSSSDRFIIVQCRIFALSVHFCIVYCILLWLQAVTCNAEKQTVWNGRSLCNQVILHTPVLVKMKEKKLIKIQSLPKVNFLLLVKLRADSDCTLTTSQSWFFRQCFSHLINGPTSCLACKDCRRTH